ncbi:MAG: asparagine synthase (glutamine-hydrolyzing) [Halioglobus sp.]|jgi:asparagine synthase (glutamine-hydrolysing)
MSGIAGIVHFHDQHVDPILIEAMTTAQAHRGPNGMAHWHGAGAALGHCMLHTTTESVCEQQPLANEDGSLLLVMDGRVDNYLELRAHLRSKRAVLRDQSDAELVLKAYQLWGQGCLAHIEGDFAFAVLHTQERQLFCARDPLGNKPFFYYWNGKTLVFASEMQAILALPDTPQVLNKSMLAQWLASQWYSRDETFWQNIQRLMAGHFMQVTAAGPKTEQYWSPDLFAPLSYSSDEQYIEHYLELFTTTVKRLSRSHKPIAAEVSGGLDSSAIFAVAQNLLKHDTLLAPGLEGYTLNFTGVPDADETYYSRAVGAHWGRTITEVAPASPELAWYRNAAAKNKDFPGVPNGVMALNLMQQAIDRDARVLLNGVGGDEWLGGGRNYYSEELASGRLLDVTRLLRRDMASEGPLNGLWYLLRGGVAPALPAPVKELLRGMRDRGQGGIDSQIWLNPQLRQLLHEQEKRYQPKAGAKYRWPGQRSELRLLNDAYIAHAREANEKLAASFGLELRLPFYTPAMVQFSFSVPKRLLFAEGVNKYAHRQAMQGLLPETVLRRQTKAEFSGTYQHYLDDLEPLLIRDIPARRPWVNAKTVRQIYDNYGEGQYAGLGEFMLWVLLGCDMLCPEE